MCKRVMPFHLLCTVWLWLTPWQRFICFTQTYVTYKSPTSHLSQLCYSVTIFGLTENCLSEWELFCPVIFPWIHKQNHNTDDHNTLIYCTYSQSSCLCSSHMAEQQFVSWLNHLRLTTDFLCWKSIFFLFLGCLRNSSLTCSFKEKKDLKTKPFTLRKWFQSPNQSRHKCKTEIATPVRLQKTKCIANEIKGKLKRAPWNVKFCSHYAICPKKWSPLRIILFIHWLYIDNIQLILDI